MYKDTQAALFSYFTLKSHLTEWGMSFGSFVTSFWTTRMINKTDNIEMVLQTPSVLLWNISYLDANLRTCTYLTLLLTCHSYFAGSQLGENRPLHQYDDFGDHFFDQYH